MNFIKITNDNLNMELFIKNKLVKEELSEMYRCNCGSLIPTFTIDKNETFFYCSRCNQSRKLNVKNFISEKIYYPLPKKIIKFVKQRLDESGLDCEEKFNEIVVKLNDSKIPLNFLEFANPSSLSPENNSIIFYYDLQEKNKIKNVYSEKRIYNLGDFLKLSRKEIKQTFLNQDKKIKIPKILMIKENIYRYCKEKSPEDFEKLLKEIFETLRRENIKVEEFLNYFKKNQNIFIGKKPIWIGSNHPADVEFIDLFEYFNDLFNWNMNRGADAKMYVESRISKDTITDKILSNHAREMVIVTNQNKILPSAWKYIWDSKKDHGIWKFFIIDLDLLSIIVCYFNLINLFNLND